MTFLVLLGAIFVLVVVFFFPRTVANIVFLYVLTRAGLMEFEDSKITILHIIFFIFWMVSAVIGFVNDCYGLDRTLEIFKNKKAKETRRKG